MHDKATEDTVEGDDVPGWEPSGDPLIDEIRASRADTQGVGRSVDTLATRVKWSRIREIVLMLVVAGVVAAIGVGVWTVGEVRNQAEETARLAADNARLNHCLAVATTAVADRLGALAPLNTARNDAAAQRADAETNLILSVLTPPPGSSKSERIAAYKAALAHLQDTNREYVAADRAFNEATAAHPLPSPVDPDGC